jgi:hypothetical protein
MYIMVNGDRFDVPRAEITYEAIAGLAGHSDSKELLVTYYARIEGDMERKGTLSPGKKITPCDGLVFNAVHTGGA